MDELPDFLQLTDDQIAAENNRQGQLRRDLNMRVRLTSVESEYARASILEPELKREYYAEPDRPELGDRIAEALAAQGRFLEAVNFTTDSLANEFYAKAAIAVFYGTECACSAPIRVVDGQTRIRLPKYRPIKEVYSMKLSRFGFLVECNSCQQWCFVGNNPLPEPIPPSEFDLANSPNDIQRLKV